MSTCQFCGSDLVDNFFEYHDRSPPVTCEKCNYYYEDRMNFSGYTFHFTREVAKRRHFKTLPFPTRENRCEHCAFCVRCTEKHVDRKTGQPCENLSDFEYMECWLLPDGYDLDFNRTMFMNVTPTSTCTRFKKVSKPRTSVITIHF